MTTKLKLSLLAAALGTALTAPAYAAIDAGANGNLFFTAWDTKGTTDSGDDSSYTRDLGMTLNEFATAATNSVIQSGQTAGVPSVVGPSVLLSFSPDSLFVDPAAGVNGWFESVSNQSNVRWNIAAVDTSGNKRVLTTARPGDVPSITNFLFTNVTTQIDTFAAQVNSLPATNPSTHQTQINGSSIATAADGPALGSGPGWGSDFGASATWNNAGGVGESLNFFLINQTTGTGNPSAVTKFAYNPDMLWTLQSNGTVAYAAEPIPEPSTYALMGLGLVGVGFAFRRAKK